MAVTTTLFARAISALLLIAFGLQGVPLAWADPRGDIPNVAAIVEAPSQRPTYDATTDVYVGASHADDEHGALASGQGRIVAPAATAAAASDAIVALRVAANGGMAGVRATGQAGETMAGIVKNTTRIPSASGKAAYRIPDELNSSVLGEVKNVSHLNYTSQLRDFAAYAQQEGLTFTLYTRGSTTFSSTLWNEINSGRIVLDTTRLGP